MWGEGGMKLLKKTMTYFTTVNSVKISFHIKKLSWYLHKRYINEIYRRGLTKLGVGYFNLQIQPIIVYLSLNA